MAVNKAIAIGGDVATGSFGLGSRGVGGTELFSSIPMDGGLLWNEMPAFDLAKTPSMFATVLDALVAQGLTIEAGSGALSFAVRQHDMVLLDADGKLLIPALSWQCNAAAAEVEQLRQSGAESVVGKVEARFILPKLMWAIERDATLKDRIHWAMTTGDWIAYRLTGVPSLSTSDALSNGLLDQDSKQLAADVLTAAGLSPDWFPSVVQSGELVGCVGERPDVADDPRWSRLRELLAGWQVVAGLGDNHATGVGCGLIDAQTIVVSAGNSGTVNRVCSPESSLAGQAVSFEYYNDRLLLLMLADCCQWYDRFVRQFAPGAQHQLGDLNRQAEESSLSSIKRVRHRDGADIYPADWSDLSLGTQVASTQFSIMLELLLLVKTMLAEVKGADNGVRQFVLTGGLSQSAFFQRIFHCGVKLLVPDSEVLISARTGPMRFQTAVSGAMINAELPSHGQDLAALLTKHCPLSDCAQPDASAATEIQNTLRSHGL